MPVLESANLGIVPALRRPFPPKPINRLPCDVEAMSKQSSHHFVSSWSQPTPPPALTKRTELISDIAERVNALGHERLRIAVDGKTAAGKTSFGHELAAAEWTRSSYAAGPLR